MLFTSILILNIVSYSFNFVYKIQQDLLALIEEIGEQEALSLMGDRFAQGLGMSEETGFDWNQLESYDVMYINTDNYGTVI